MALDSCLEECHFHVLKPSGLEVTQPELRRISPFRVCRITQSLLTESSFPCSHSMLNRASTIPAFRTGLRLHFRLRWQGLAAQA